MFRYAFPVLFSFVASGALAQQPLPQSDPASAQSKPAADAAAKPVVAMEEARPGDRWTYEIHDEITGTVKFTRTNIVTEVTPTEISTRVDTLGKQDPGLIVYDRTWNVISSGPWKYSPNDGAGIRMPLTIGATWTFRSNDINAANGNIWKRSGHSKIVGQETVTTKAGSFETYKIETTYSSQSVKDPTRKAEITAATWYAPAINHWVKRTFISRANKHLMVSNVIELVEYGRK